MCISFFWHIWFTNLIYYILYSYVCFIWFGPKWLILNCPEAHLGFQLVCPDPSHHPHQLSSCCSSVLALIPEPDFFFIYSRFTYYLKLVNLEDCTAAFGMQKVSRIQYESVLQNRFHMFSSEAVYIVYTDIWFSPYCCGRCLENQRI